MDYLFIIVLVLILHQLTPVEMSMMTPDLGDDVVLRRLCLVLAFKQAYIKAIGQPIGFDWSR